MLQILHHFRDFPRHGRKNMTSLWELMPPHLTRVKNLSGEKREKFPTFS